MIHLKRIFAVLFILFFSTGLSIAKPKYEVAKISTQFGDIYIYLYQRTPIHKANFIRVANDGIYNGTTFHRVIAQFMIQGGDPNSKDKDSLNDGSGGPVYTGLPYQQKANEEGYDSYTIPAELREDLHHKRGALASARTGNPERRSSGSQFYIAIGKVYDLNELKNLQERKNIKMTPEAVAEYSTVGGIPFLDNEYTVYGQTIQGIEIVDKIVSQPKGPNDRPYSNVTMTVKIEKYSAKKLRKKFKYELPAAELQAYQQLKK
ncbi:MAG: peptidylprolyl isomerase [Bacteroidota bacterium]|nr:peptidylprolyl isomerase [Bacteroidota bacterium]